MLTQPMHLNHVSELAITLEQIGRTLHASCFAKGLHSVQWSALRYFSRVRPERATVNGLAGFQGTTAAPASRTVAALVRKGLLTSTVNPKDRRSRSMNLTAKGRTLLSEDPLLRLDTILNKLGVSQREITQQVLSQVMDSLQQGYLPQSHDSAVEFA